MNEREAFYEYGVSEFIKDRDARILVCGGGVRDRDVFERLNFRNVTISNLDARMKGDEFSPFQWKYENAESLSFERESFDYVVIHAAIHHASSPHRVLTEMFRVAKKGLLAFESRDSFVIRCLERFGVTQTYEQTAVYYNDCKFGGVNNTDIPNYVYRWTEREIEKTIQSYAPHSQHAYRYRYGVAFPATPKRENRGGIKIGLLNLLRPVFGLLVKLFPKQQNLFAFYVEKPPANKALFPWLKYNEAEGRIAFSKEWGDLRYKSRKSPGEPE